MEVVLLEMQCTLMQVTRQKWGKAYILVAYLANHKHRMRKESSFQAGSFRLQGTRGRN